MAGADPMAAGAPAPAAAGARPPQGVARELGDARQRAQAAVASIGRISVFWFGLVAKALSASRYFWATK